MDYRHRPQGARDLTDKQAAALLKAGLRAQADAIEASKPRAAVASGKQLITGEIVSTKWVESQYGETLKMLIKTDGGAKLWGTLPRALTEVEGEIKGRRVQFSATVEASKDDPYFGFFSRPTKAAVL